jgi:hypothetical protein
VLYPHKGPPEASPKAISGRTSYLRVRLAFHPYPQVIRRLFNDGRFGPPREVNLASPCPWVAHPVSGLHHATISPFSDSLSLRLRILSLTLLHNTTRRSVLQKVRHHSTYSRTLTACKHMVSGSISLPSRGAFHLSLTVLVHYRSSGGI